MNRSDILSGAKPIIFSTPMVQAILEGKKTQTRRVVKPQPPIGLQYPYGFISGSSDNKIIGSYGWTVGEICDGRVHTAKPRYKPGDILWVRETWMPCATIDSLMSDTDLYTYKADWTDISLEMQKNGVMGKYAKWRPSIHMPRAAARIFLRVTDVRVERVQEISEGDAKAEGIRSYWLTKEAGKGADDWHESSGPPFIGATKEVGADLCHTRREAFRQLWDTINAKRSYGWDANPWCWVYTFERLEVPT